VFGARGDVAVAVAGNLRSNNGDALRTAAIAGQGLLYQPTFMVADHLRAGTARNGSSRKLMAIEYGGAVGNCSSWSVNSGCSPQTS
jgi:hypothetical protein